MVWPLATHAQQSAAPVIGFLDGQTPDTRLMMAFRQALKDAGLSREGTWRSTTAPRVVTRIDF